MEIMEAKKLVIEAGKQLVASGLIARTWGNVSCRVGDGSFVITPSGKPYEGLTPADIVEVKIDSLEYEGEVKPSSEKGVHALVYKAHPEAGFVIHTHQNDASAVSVLGSGIDKLTGEAARVIGDKVLLGGYGMPGTGKLRKGVAAALEASKQSKAVIMARHGALCFGKDRDEAFEVVNMLEKVCGEYVLNRAGEVLGQKFTDFDTFCGEFVKKHGDYEKTVEIVNSIVYNSVCDRERSTVTFSAPDCDDIVMNLPIGKVEGDALLPVFAEYHRDIYLLNPGLSYIIHNNSPEVVAVSALGESVKPLLDDFAQLVGTKINCVSSAEEAKRVIKNQNAVFIKGCGALCCGGVESDACAVDMIMSKGCKAQLAAKLFNAKGAISFIDSKIMRFVYLKKYSKQAS